MASISNDPNGLKRILFVNSDGDRKVIRLGKMSKRQADTVKRHIESLIASKRSGDVPIETTKWLSERDDAFRGKLAAVDLIDPPKKTLLGPFVVEYVDKRRRIVKASTRSTDHLTQVSMLAFFGENRPLRQISAGDAKDFRNWMLSGSEPVFEAEGSTHQERKPLAEATVRKRCSVAGKIMGDALDRGLIERNPFSRNKGVPTANIATKRRAYINAADAQRVLTEIPTTEWKLLFALARWGGLRIGSEVRRLTWADINWEHQRITVHSPKTEHHEGRETRLLPIFPELAPLLAKRFDEATEGEAHVLPMLLSRTDAALRKPLEKAIKSAGLTVWPRLWHSLRATRQTELENSFPSHVVCAWLGNTKAVADKHYLVATEDHYLAACMVSTEAAQKPAQSALDSGDSDGQGSGPLPKTSEESSVVILGQSLSNNSMLPVGLEPTTY